MDDLTLEVVERLAPGCSNLADLGRQVNEALGLTWSDGKWRGIWKNESMVRLKANRKLGRDLRPSSVETIAIEGNVRGLVVSDIHAPYHDSNGLRLTAKIIKWWDPDVLIFNGDDFDFSELSIFNDSPSRVFSVQDEIEIWQEEAALPLIAACSRRTRKIKVSGNHDRRLRTWTWRNPGLHSLRALDLPNIFGLSEFGIDYAELRVRFGLDLEVTHGEKVSKWAGMSARAELEARRYAISTITGHVHRDGLFSTRTLLGWRYGLETPCLCSLSPDYKVDPDWTNGISLFEVRDHKVHVQSVRFYEDYTACVGKQWIGVD